MVGECEAIARSESRSVRHLVRYFALAFTLMSCPILGVPELTPLRSYIWAIMALPLWKEHVLMTARFRDLPSVQKVLSNPRVRDLIEGYSYAAVLDLVRVQMDKARDEIVVGGDVPALDDIVISIESEIRSRWRQWPRLLINATGVVLHTNLGRSPLSEESIEAIFQASSGYSELEFDVDTGKRGSRQSHITRMVCQLTGAPAAYVVNNNASALMLGLIAIARGSEVIVSRGEAVEIGGGFRIPDVLRQSGVHLVEVGTTNRTYVGDFERAITDKTGAILSVHSSNFRISGFTHAPALHELVDLGRKRGIPVLHDLGSGCLLDTAQFGLAHEPMPQESISSGASLAFFSGDKLLGGPQAGIIAGDAELVDNVSKHPMARAVRIDKLSMAALTATLLHYVKGEAAKKIPIWRMIAEPASGLKPRVLRWQESICGPTNILAGDSTIGGGSLPGEILPTWLLSVDASSQGGADSFGARLRRGAPPVVGRIGDQRVMLDPRTVLPDQDDALVKVVSDVLGTWE